MNIKKSFAEVVDADKWYFRGTANGWAATEMTLVSGTTWQTVQDFTGNTSPRFKIDHKGDWTESYPSADYTVSTKKYTITFNSSTKAISAVEITAPVISASPAGGSFDTLPVTVTLSLSGASSGSYTLDGTDPAVSSTAKSFTNGQQVSVGAALSDGQSATLKLYAIENNQASVKSYIFTKTADTTPPTISTSHAAGNYTSAINVKYTISDNKSGITKVYYTTNGIDPTTSSTLYTQGDATARISGTTISIVSNTTVKLLAIDVAGNRTTATYAYTIGAAPVKSDFRDETIYFVMTSRFYDGDTSNNVHCWDDAKAKNPDSDPAWRGDFKGLIQKLDYIKALGFSAVWITPVVQNSSGYDYHGYHAINFNRVDPRYESSGGTYQDLINACHAKGLKIIQDIVLNHSGNFGEENLYPLFKKNSTVPDIAANLVQIDGGKLPADYATMTPTNQFNSRINAMKEDSIDTNKIYHHEKSLSWESYTVQTGQIDGDCVDLNTENPTTANYLIDAYKKYINMGVDSFRVDTAKHISRLTFNNYFTPAFKEAGGENFFIFGEVCSRYRQVWNSGIPAISTPFFTWKESKTYPWGTREQNETSVAQNWADNSTTAGQPESTNYKLNGNLYHTPDYSKRSGFDVIDFPMHWNFNNARDAFNVALDGDKYYNDPSWNVTYVDSHDYAPDGAPEKQRFAGSQDTWAENLNLMFAFRGIPCIYYGSEIEFQKGMPIDVGPNAPLSTTGRAYFGDKIEGSVSVNDFGVYSNATGTMATTLSHPLSKHIQRLNLIRRAIPALKKGQYSTDGVSGSGMAFKRRYTANGVDSFVLVTISGDATFTGVPGGKYVDAVTGNSVTVAEGGTLNASCSGKGNMRIYVLNGSGKIGTDGTYLK